MIKPLKDNLDLGIKHWPSSLEMPTFGCQDQAFKNQDYQYPHKSSVFFEYKVLKFFSCLKISGKIVAYKNVHMNTLKGGRGLCSQGFGALPGF